MLTSSKIVSVSIKAWGHTRPYTNNKDLQVLQEPPALGLLHYSKPFMLFVHERDNQTLEMITEEYGSKHRPVAY